MKRSYTRCKVIQEYLELAPMLEYAAIYKARGKRGIKKIIIHVRGPFPTKESRGEDWKGERKSEGRVRGGR
jgi:hypothetical protein